MLRAVLASKTQNIDDKNKALTLLEVVSSPLEEGGAQMCHSTDGCMTRIWIILACCGIGMHKRIDRERRAKVVNARYISAGPVHTVCMAYLLIVVVVRSDGCGQ